MDSAASRVGAAPHYGGAMARQVRLIGIGAGSPDLLTQQAIAALNEVDVFLAADKGSSRDELVAVRKAICERFIDPGHDYRFMTLPDPQRGPDAERGSSEYEAAVRAWHAARARTWAAAIDELPADAVVGFLVWGDPAFYDSTIRVVDQIGGHTPLEVRVVPGISAFQALAAAHGIVLHEVGQPVHVTTGRRLVSEVLTASGAGIDLGQVVVMLDGHLACRELVDLPGTGRWRIHWGACLGLPQQELRVGWLDEVVDEIAQVRARLREQHGWVMDVYTLSRA